MDRPPVSFLQVRSGLALLAACLAVPGTADSTPKAASTAVGAAAAAPVGPDAGPSYADLADLADRAESVVRAKVRKFTPIDAARAPGLRPGWGRVLVEARATALLAGPPLAGDSLRYLLDLPLGARGQLPKAPKGEVIAFARRIAQRPGELQLVAPDAQIAWDPATDARLKGVLGELLAAGAPPRITGVREAIHVAGALAGEGETQLFLSTAGMTPASISVVRHPGEAARWSVSFSEVLETDARVPQRDTLVWYRLACFLPDRLP
ncbi:MAG TPA: hypothetical protein VI199_00225, partial [Novosphingobium sp.]